MGIKNPKCDSINPSDFKYYKECATPLPFSIEIPILETLVTSKKELTTGPLIAERYEIIEELGKGGMIISRWGQLIQ